MSFFGFGYKGIREHLVAYVRIILSQINKNEAYHPQSSQDKPKGLPKGKQSTQN